MLKNNAQRKDLIVLLKCRELLTYIKILLLPFLQHFTTICRPTQHAPLNFWLETSSLTRCFISAKMFWLEMLPKAPLNVLQYQQRWSGISDPTPMFPVTPSWLDRWQWLGVPWSLAFSPNLPITCNCCWDCSVGRKDFSILQHLCLPVLNLYLVK